VAFDESLAARVRDALTRTRGATEKTMFGGRCFLLHGNLLVGVWGDGLIVRLGPGGAEDALREPHVRAFDVTGRPMRNWVVVDPDGVDGDAQLRAWIDRAVAFVRTLPGK
jgi:hypothetical protein